MKKKVLRKTKTAKNLITKDMGLGEVIQRFPQTMHVFGKYGIHCIGCSMSAFETVEQGAMAHGINVKKFIEDLNKAAQGK